MPPDSDAAQAKKARKKPRPPQAISQETWKAVEAAICIGGLGYSEAGRKFGIEPHAIIMKAKRHGWALPSMIQKRVEALQKSVTERAVCEDYRNGNAEVIEAVAQSWSERGEEHRALVYGITTAALKKVAKAPPPIESWSDIEKADRAGRRSCGLDDSERNQNINIGMQLIEYRLANISLPPERFAGFRTHSPPPASIRSGKALLVSRLYNCRVFASQPYSWALRSARPFLSALGSPPAFSRPPPARFPLSTRPLARVCRGGFF